jgi:hypothetical protein
MIENKGYVVVTDYIEANSGKDVSDAIQQIINNNPHRTIYFPDGEYILAKPICTPANPATAVSLELSNFATLKAIDGWDHTEAMVRLGAAEPYNNIHLCGSNFSFKGGIVDGNKVATGIAIEGGRETLVTRTSIKNTQIGIHIKRIGNGASSDADVEQVNIVGNNMPNSIGVFVEGFDNTIHNMRIAAIQTGILLTSAGNSLRDLHPLFIYGYELHAKCPDYYDDVDRIDFSKSIGFDDQSGGNNWYSYCYSDQLATGFRFKGGATPVFEHCFAMWYSPNGDKEIGYECVGGKMCASINSANVELRGDAKNRAFLKVSEPGGTGVVQNPIFMPDNCDDDAYKDYLIGHVVHRA